MTSSSPSDALLAELYASPRDEADQALAERYAPVIRFDAREPFTPLAAGYTVVRAGGRSPSFDRELSLSPADGHPAATVIEYAVWWDWDIQHLYELEHVWVYLDEAGRVVHGEASWHGGMHSMRVGGELPIEGERLVVCSEPGKHAFAPEPGWFEPFRRPHPRATTLELAGEGGLLVTALYRGRIARTPLADTLARTFLADHAFVPGWEFARRFSFPPEMLVPWGALDGWIPRRVAAIVERLRAELPPSDYRPLRASWRPWPLAGLGNTLEGLSRGAARGYDLAGATLHLTADGAIVAAPRPYVRAAGGLRPIAASTLAELADPAAGERRVPTLAELCGACGEERVGLFLELADRRVIGPALAELARLEMLWGAVLAAPRPDWLLDVRAAEPDAITALQCDSPTLDAVAAARLCGATFVQLCWERFEGQPPPEGARSIVAAAREAGLGVIGWYTEEPASQALQHRLGLDAVCFAAPMRAPSDAERARRRILAVCIDFGDTLAEATEVKDSGEVTQRAELIPGAAELVWALRERGYRLALVADGRPGTYRNVLGEHGLYEAFDVHAISDHIGATKPDPRNFAHALDQLGMRPDEAGRAVMLGNNLSADVRGANAAGMVSVWLDWSPRRAKVPADEHEVPAATIRLPLELLDVLDRLEQGER